MVGNDQYIIKGKNQQEIFKSRLEYFNNLKYYLTQALAEYNDSGRLNDFNFFMSLSFPKMIQYNDFANNLGLRTSDLINILIERIDGIISLYESKISN